jgi:hypothetical protein
MDDKSSIANGAQNDVTIRWRAMAESFDFASNQMAQQGETMVKALAQGALAALKHGPEARAQRNSTGRPKGP